jgi:hypothetical protein
MRLVGGVVMLVVTIGVMVALGGASRVVRLAVFLPMLMTTVLFLQVRARTCIALAARGQRDLDRAPERINDVAELAAVKAQARSVTLQSVLLAAVVTLVYVMV